MPKTNKTTVPHSNNIHLRRSSRVAAVAAEAQPISDQHHHHHQPAMTTSAQPFYRLPKVSLGKDGPSHPSHHHRHSVTGATAHSSSSHSRSPSSSSSTSFCDNTSAASGHTSQSAHYQLQQPPPPLSPPDPELHNILENWFEVEFQRQFKRLNGLIKNASSRSGGGGGGALNSCTLAADDDSSEILFLRQKIDQHLATAPNSKFVIPLSASTSASSSHSLSLNGNRTGNRSQADSTQLTSWLMGRRAGGSGAAEATLKNQTIHEERAFEPVMLRPKMVPQNGQQNQNTSSLDNSWITGRLLQIEQLLQWEAASGYTSTSDYSNLICLAITEPNEKANRVESLLYSYPPAKTEPTNSTVHHGSNLYHLSSGTPSRTATSTTTDLPLVKLGGMFITLSEVVDILRISTLSRQQPQQQQPQNSTPMQTCCLQVMSTGDHRHPQPTSLSLSSSAAGKLSPPTSRTYLFTILRYTFSPESPMNLMDSTVDAAKYVKPSKKPPTILLLVGLPKDNGFTEGDSRCAAQLLEQTLVHRFRTVQAAFEPFFLFPSSSSSSSSSSSGSPQSTTHLLGQCCHLLDALISPPPSSNSSGTLEAQLTLTNTFFSCSGIQNGENTPTTSFPLRHLPFDESASLQTCKLLNYFDSLDWLDEAIGRFYRRDSMDLEHALSEHFARCLQWPPDSPPNGAGGEEDFTLLKATPAKPKKVSSTSLMNHLESAKSNNNNNNYNNNNNNNNNNITGHNQQNNISIDNIVANGPTQLFDLLEVELSTFVITGSVIFYRGLLVQSNISHSMLNYVHRTLWSKGFSALTKYLPYDLLYFTKVDESHLGMFKSCGICFG